MPEANGQGTSAGGAVERDVLRLTTAGSVDDGRSTLIGRRLHDTQSIPDDQLEALAGATRRRGESGLNLALLTDGLHAEREQNITIDVAYRYFATPRRRFIVADTPGHRQYTRNVVTGASSADLAIVLVDARRGLLPQSKRHGFIASRLGIRHVLVAVDKMDLVGHDEAVFRDIAAQYRAFAESLEGQAVGFVPISALRGDNVVTPSARMPWYEGGTLLHELETRRVDRNGDDGDFRLPVHYVVRPHQDFRGVERVAYRVDVETLGRATTTRVALDDVACVEVAAAEPLWVDPCRTSWETGSSVLVDPYINAIVAAGMIRDGTRGDAADADVAAPPAVQPSRSVVPRSAREQRSGHRAAVVWFTGLSGAGKSTLAHALEWRLFERAGQTMVLDGDELRTGLCRDLGFSAADRRENVRRAAEVARLCFEQGAIVLCTFVSPYHADRDAARALVPAGRFYEVHVACPVEVCRRRDPKGHCARADAGELPQLTGVGAPWGVAPWGVAP